MKRIRYVSHCSQQMSQFAIEALARSAAEYNRQNDITGLLLANGGLFFQILEGPRNAVESLFERIRVDPRHGNVIVLSEEFGNFIRICPDWSMKTVDLSVDASEQMIPLKALLQLLCEQNRLVEMTREALERSAWNLIVEAELKDLKLGAG